MGLDLNAYLSNPSKQFEDFSLQLRVPSCEASLIGVKEVVFREVFLTSVKC